MHIRIIRLFGLWLLMTVMVMTTPLQAQTSDSLIVNHLRECGISFSHDNSVTLLMNGQDEVIGIEDNLLLVSLDATLEETVDAIHAYGGKVILAHVLDRQNSVTTQLGFIPMGLAYDGLEVKSEEQKLRVLETHPWIKEEDTYWFIDSDAHRLIDMSEADNFMRDSVFRKLWGDDII